MASIVINKENAMSGIMSLVNKRMTRTAKFLGEDITIQKLTVGEVKKIQSLAKELEDSEDDDGLKVLELVIRSSVEGAEELTREHFEAWPMDELSTLSEQIMSFSGFNQKDVEGKSA